MCSWKPSKGSVSREGRQEPRDSKARPVWPPPEGAQEEGLPGLACVGATAQVGLEFWAHNGRALPRAGAL